MPLSPNINNREFDKFVETSTNNTAVRVQGELDAIPAGLGVGGRISEVSLNSSSWVALPAVPLDGRNALSIQNQSGQTIKINYDNSVSGFVGISIATGSERYYDIKDTIVLYGKCTSASATIVVEEIS